MTTIYVDNIEPNLQSRVKIPGHVVQEVSVTKTDTFSSTSTIFTDITGLSATITPKSTQSKIQIIFTVYFAMITANWGGMIRLQRGGVPICIGDSAGSRTLSSGAFYMVSNNQFVNSISNNFLDSPNTTSATTYNLAGRTQSASSGFCINRNGNDGDTSSVPRLASTLTLMEIGG